MARSPRALSKSMRPIPDEKSGRTMLPCGKTSPHTAKKEEKPEKDDSPRKVRLRLSLPKAKTVLKAARQATHPVKRVVLKMWNGSRIAMYPAEFLALRCNGRVYKHKMKKARCLKIVQALPAPQTSLPTPTFSPDSDES